MSKYLYGASVQGIQDFIFKTNKLQEIVGASEIVKNISSIFEDMYRPNEIIINAAGNIKAVFDTKIEIEKTVLEFPKLIQKMAYGITISQAVIKIETSYNQSDIGNLEKKLKIQRNKPTLPLDMSINILKLHPSTSKPAVSNEQDMAIKQKLDAYKKIENDETYKELSNLSNKKNKIAIVHIDGNGLGQLIPNLTIPLSEFSKKLDIATKQAFEKAKKDKKIREIILGGDDVTVICEADYALDFTKEFLENFEKETKENFKKLTACAGIAYCNEKYPFHYAVELAESLCSVAKKHSKEINENLAPSSLMFHNIQSSNFQYWDKFVNDELIIENDKQEIRCDFGPYYLNQENRPSIQNFIYVVESLRLKSSPSSRLREWLSELYKSDTNAEHLLNRINAIFTDKKEFKKDIFNKNLEKLEKGLKLNNLIINGKTPIYDLLQILSITDTLTEEKIK